MPPLPKPTFDFAYRPDTEIARLRAYRDTKPGRAIPAKVADRLLLATWNIANLGLQERRDQDYRIIAELISWFDAVAIQEVNDNLAGLYAIHQHLPAAYRRLFSDAGGNKERLAFLYDSSKITLLDKVGEVAIPPSDIRNIRLAGITQRFDGFDRNPYLAAFTCQGFVCLLVNVHLFFGSDSKRDMNRRSLETYAVARWADNRRRNRNAYTRDIIVLGDFNLPKPVVGDPIFEALTRRGLHLPAHSTEMGSSLNNLSHYDQVAFFPGETQDDFTGNTGVFDFDGAIFKDLWDTGRKDDFFQYVRYYISDHRPLWVEFRVQ